MALETVIIVASSQGWTLVSNAATGRFRAQVLEGVPVLFSIGATAPASDLELGMPAVSLNFDALDGKVWARGAGIDAKVAVTRVVDAGNPAIPMLASLALSATSYSASAAAGTVIATISNRIAGSKIAVTPNDGRFAISDDGATVRLVVGLTASSAGVTEITLSEVSEKTANSPRRTKIQVTCTPPALAILSNLVVTPLTAGASWAAPRFRDIFKVTYNATGIFTKTAISWRAGGTSTGEFENILAVNDRFVGKTILVSVSLLDALDRVVAGPLVSSFSGIVTDTLKVLDNLASLDGLATGNVTVTLDTSARGAPGVGWNLKTNSANNAYIRKTIGLQDSSALKTIAVMYNTNARRALNNFNISFKRTNTGTCTISTTKDSVTATVTAGNPPCPGDTLAVTVANGVTSPLPAGTRASAVVGNAITLSAAATDAGTGWALTCTPNYTTRTSGKSQRDLANAFDGGGVLIFDASEEDASTIPITAQKPAQSFDMQISATANAPYTADVTASTVLADAAGIGTVVWEFDDMHPSVKTVIAPILEQYGFRMGVALDVDKLSGPEDGVPTAINLSADDIRGLDAAGHVIINDVSPTDDTLLRCKTLAEVRAGYKKNEDWIRANTSGRGLGIGVLPNSEFGVLGHPSSVTVTLTAGSPTVALSAAPAVPILVEMRSDIDGILAKAKVTNVNGLTVTMDSNSTASGTFSGRFYGTGFNGSVIDSLSITSGSTAASMGAAPAVAPRVGMEVDANGVPAGTTITDVNGLNLTLSAAATATGPVKANAIETTGIFYGTKALAALAAEGATMLGAVIGESFYSRFGYQPDLWLRHPRYGIHGRSVDTIKAAIDLAELRGTTIVLFTHSATTEGGSINIKTSDLEQIALYVNNKVQAGRMVCTTIDKLKARDFDGAARLPTAA